MSKQNTFKTARDRFVAFTFASSDFLLEINKAGNIMFTAGKVLSLTGFEPNELTGQDWLNIFAQHDQSDLAALLKGVQRAGRIGPLMVNIKNRVTKETNKAMVMGMTIPESPHIFLSFNAADAFLDFLAMGDFQNSQLLDNKQFEENALKAFSEAKKEGKSLDVTFLDTDKLDNYKKSLSPDEAKNFSDSFNSILKEQAYEGKMASKIDGNKYALIHDTKITPEFIESKIQEMISKSAPNAKYLEVSSKTIEADMDGLNEREARRALVYTINQIEQNGMEATSEKLSRGFEDYLDENATKIANLKKLIGHQAFKLNFQPIVFLPDLDLCHYEALVRFDHNESPYELITFGEDIGLAPDIDISILKQAIGFVNHNLAQGNSIRIAVNISGVSIQSEKFFLTMLSILQETDVSPNNILFEITESTAINDLERVNEYLQELRRRGYEICLDDFGAGAASFQYLNSLDIDCVKIDGKYIKDALNSPRDEAMVRNLARMCRDLNVTTIAEMVENKEQMEYLHSIGIDKAQGWYFGKPTSKAEYSK